MKIRRWKGIWGFILGVLFVLVMTADASPQADFSKATVKKEIPQAIRISDSSVVEGNSGTVAAVFEVTLSTPHKTVVTIDYMTGDATATVALNDYAAARGTMAFNPGEMKKTLAVAVSGDNVTEGNEYFYVRLMNPVNATFFNDQGIGRIVNDDTSRLSINDVTVIEGNGGRVDAVFTVTLSVPHSLAVTVDFGTMDNTATVAGRDYEAASWTMTFNPGETRKTTRAVAVIGDRMTEPNETFYVRLNNSVNAPIDRGNGIGTITNDD